MKPTSGESFFVIALLQFSQVTSVAGGAAPSRVCAASSSAPQPSSNAWRSSRRKRCGCWWLMPRPLMA